MWAESDNRTPLICFLSMGSDPTNSIEGLAKKLKLECHSISMGQGQEIHARRLLQQSITSVRTRLVCWSNKPYLLYWLSCREGGSCCKIATWDSTSWMNCWRLFLRRNPFMNQVVSGSQQKYIPNFPSPCSRLLQTHHTASYMLSLCL